MRIFITFFLIHTFFLSIQAHTIEANYMTSSTNMEDLPPIAKLIAEQEKDFTRIQLFKNNKLIKKDYTKYIETAQFLNLKSSNLKTFFDANLNNVLLEIPSENGTNIELKLTQVEVTTPDFKVETSDGKIFTFDEAIPWRFYRGIVNNQPNTLVAITVFENSIRGLVSSEQGNHVLGLLPKTSTQYVYYNDKDLKIANSATCGVTDEMMNMGEDFSTIEKSSENNSSNCVEIYVECDYHMYNSHNGSVNSVTNFVGALLNEVGILYANESINVSLSSVFVWTSTDPYASQTSTLGVLQAFGASRQNNYDGRLAHLISTRNLGGGIAWVDMLCRNYLGGSQHAGPYAVSANMGTNVTPFPTYSWEVMVFAHEMGHNFGSRHTHDCVWGPNNDMALDNCYTPSGNCSPGPAPTNGGTIMSYCHLTSNGINFNNGFGQEPGDLLRDRFNNGTCDLSCDNSSTCTIACPSDLNIACTDDYNDLTITGQATANCGSGTASYTDDLSNLSGCSGYIVRTWTVSDNGESASCIQQITIGTVSSCAVNDSLALVALYNSTDGTSWTNTWDLTQPMDTWYGVTLNVDRCVTCLDLDGYSDCSDVVFAGGNNLVGNIPIELGNLSQLTELHLNYNQLSGNIPLELANLSKLIELTIFGNQLSGNIPSVLGNLSQLQKLQLGNNHLSGSIPSELGNLSQLKHLQLWLNQLSGNIPVSLGNLIQLERLLLRKNQLSGNIPSSLGNLINLIEIRLSYNQLSGCFPPELSSLCTVSNRSFNNNPDLPGAGDFDAFCADGTGSCNNADVCFAIGDICGSAGDIVSIPVIVNNFTDINAFQFSIHVPNNIGILENTPASNYMLANMGNNDFHRYDDHTITVTWEASDIFVGETVADGTVIFTIEMQLTGTAGATGQAYIDGNPTPIEILQNLDVVDGQFKTGNICIESTYNIDGQVMTYYNTPVNNVTMDINGDLAGTTNTDNTGVYNFSNLDAGSNITLTPSKDYDVQNGVTISDVLRIRGHIQQIPAFIFTSPYQYIAADVNDSETISIADVLHIRRVIQNEVPNFPINKSWRFIPTDHTFINPDNPFPFPEERNYMPLNQNQVNQDFTGVKLGDVNESTDTSQFSSTNSGQE